MGEVRIIGGQWKRSKLPVPDAPGLRPTSDRIRETLFNWLGQTLTGWRVLDAFAGSGALGFEAASRGADEVVLVERDAQLVAGLRASVRRLQATTMTVHAADALLWMRAAPRGPHGVRVCGRAETRLGLGGGRLLLYGRGSTGVSSDWCRRDKCPGTDSGAPW